MYCFTRKSNCFTRKDKCFTRETLSRKSIAFTLTLRVLRVKQLFYAFTRKTLDFSRKTLDFTRKTLDFTRKTVIYDTNGLP